MAENCCPKNNKIYSLSKLQARLTNISNNIKVINLTVCYKTRVITIYLTYEMTSAKNLE